MNNKILIVSANYYKEISKNLELGAINTLKEYGYEYEVINAPGCFEIPFFASTKIITRSTLEAPVTMLRVYCSCPGESTAINFPFLRKSK